MVRFKQFLFENYLPGFVPFADPSYDTNPTFVPDVYGPPAVPGLPGGKFKEGQVYYNPATGYTYRYVGGYWQIISSPNTPPSPPPPANQDPQEIAPTRIPGRKGQTPGRVRVTPHPAGGGVGRPRN